MTGYVSPYGKPEGLSERLATWAERMGQDRSLPWAGLGIIADLELAVTILEGKPPPVDPVRAALVDLGFMSADDTTTDVADLLKVLLG